MADWGSYEHNCDALMYGDIDVSDISFGPQEEKEEDHTGMIQNPITGEWSFL